MRWKAYPQYAESFNTWLGLIPANWNLSRIKRRCSLLNGYAFDSDTYVLEGIPIIRIGDIGEPINWQELKRVPEEMLKNLSRFRILKGDLLIALTGATIGKSCQFNCERLALLNQRVGIIRSIDMLQTFLRHFIHSEPMRKSIEWLCYGGAQENIGKDDIGNIQVAVPPSDEQHAIAVFLDRETERIDSLIAKKQRQIELLNEKRSALISRAVTKGLNPDARMKDSGIEWLGEIPEHWDVHLLKRVAGITYGVSGELDRTLTEGIHILSLPNIGIDGNLHLEDVPFVQVEEGQEQSILLLHGDLLFNWRNGSSAHLGKTAYFDLEGKYTHVSFLLRIRFPLDKHEPRYFHRLLNGLRVTGFFSSSKAGVNNTFNQSELENLWIIIPPLDEQIAIADFLDREIRTIDALADCVENSIITLHEYRTALITATVTGKIDVRQEASHARTTH